MNDYDDYEDELFKEFKELLNAHEIKTMVQKSMPLIRELDVEFYERIIGAQAYESYDDHERIINLEMFTEHLKIVFKVGSKGYKSAWIEPLMSCDCENTCECD